MRESKEQERSFNRAAGPVQKGTVIQTSLAGLAAGYHRNG